MQETLRAGSDVLAGAYSCNRCAQVVTTTALHSLPPCPGCSNDSWQVLRRSGSRA